MSSRIEILAPAKVNLRLVVLAREESGYHTLETLFCAVSLADEVRLERGGSGVELQVEGEIETGPAAENLVVRAARAFYARLGVEPRVRIRLLKRIPAAAGLGGGSSDAAATLRGLNRLEGDPLGSGELLQLGATLGSDVPFFLGDSPFALAWGRGQRLLSLPPLPPRAVLIGHPNIAMPTPAAFHRLAELRESRVADPALSIPIGALAAWEGVERYASNDFAPVAAERIASYLPAVHALEQHGARIALLAGSGAAVFGVFPEQEVPAAAIAALGAQGCSTWQARTLERWPEPMRQD